MMQLDIESKIADTPPCIGGEGVYTARAILGYTEALPETNRSLEKQNEENSANGTVIIYTNPANDDVFVLFDGYQILQAVDLEIYNMLGTLMLKKQLITGSEAVSVSTANLGVGCYIFILKNTSKILYKDRLIIIK